MAISYKQKCARCNKNYVTATWKTRYVLCYDCQKKELQGEITDPAMKKMFDIPDAFYESNAFLRSIKLNYLRFGDLSGDQVKAYKNVVKQLQEEAGGKPKPKPASAPAVKPKPAKAPAKPVKASKPKRK